MTAYDPYLRGPFPVASVACEALTPILVRERGVVDDDLEVALGVLLVAERVPASASRVTQRHRRVFGPGETHSTFVTDESVPVK